MRDEDARAAIAAGIVGSGAQVDELLASIVRVARAIFAARAASILLHDEESDELVFAAVSEEADAALVGTRFPSDTGIAGWVLAMRQPLVLDDVGQDPRFARGVAESTGYVPSSLMAVPLLHGDRALGVLEVLDRAQETPFTLAELDLLALFATQAAIALDLFARTRRAEDVLASGGELGALARLASRLSSGADDRRAAALDLLAALDRLLAG